MNANCPKWWFIPKRLLQRKTEQEYVDNLPIPAYKLSVCDNGSHKWVSTKLSFLLWFSRKKNIKTLFAKINVLSVCKDMPV